jgi:exodeoxyribonuclease VII large subunit
MAVPVRGDLLGQLRELGHRIHRCALRALDRGREQLDATARRWPERDALLAPQRQRLDDLADRLPRALRTELSHARAALGQTAGALRPGLLRAAHARARERLEALWRVAELAHPNRPLQRGYARVEDQGGKTLISAAAARTAQRLRLIFADGDVEAQVGAPGPVERPRRAAYVKPTGEQPKLL